MVMILLSVLRGGLAAHSLGGELGPQVSLSDLAAGRAREFVHEHDPLGDLVFRQAPRQVLGDGLRLEGGTGLEGNDRHGQLSPLLVGDADECDGGDVGA